MQTNHNVFTQALKELSDEELLWVGGGAEPTSGKKLVVSCTATSNGVSCFSGYHDYDTKTSHA